MEYNGVEVHSKNGEVLSCDASDAQKFLECLARKSLSENPLIAIKGKYAINAKEVLYVIATKLN